MQQRTMKKIFETTKKGRNRSGSNSREKEVTLEGVVKHKEELMKLLEIEERNFLARKEGIERNLVEIEKHEIVLR